MLPRKSRAVSLDSEEYVKAVVPYAENLKNKMAEVRCLGTVQNRLAAIDFRQGRVLPFHIQAHFACIL